jgi:hypothetical protein
LNGNPAGNIKLRGFVTTAGIRFQQTFSAVAKARETILKGFKNLKSAKTVIGTWVVHYNYLRPDEIVVHNTPAYHAGIRSYLKAKLR